MDISIVTFFGDGGHHNITSDNSGLGIYHVLNSSSVTMQDPLTSIIAPEGMGQMVPTFLIEENSNLFISGRDISIFGSNGTADRINGGPAIQITNGSLGYFESFGEDHQDTLILLSGGLAYGEGNIGGDALHFDGEETEGSIMGGNFKGGPASMGTPGNSLRVTNSAEVSINGGNFYGNVLVENALLDITNGFFDESSSEIIVSGEGGFVIFQNGCFNLTQSKDDEEVVYVRGNFVTNDELGPYQEIIALQINGGLVGKSDHPDCSSFLSSDSPTKSPSFAPTSKAPTTHFDPIIIDDGGFHDITQLDSGIAIYQVLRSSRVNMEDPFTTIRAPDGLGRESPTFLIDDEGSQIFIAGQEILIVGSNGTSANENGGPAIQVTGGSRGYFEQSDLNGPPISVKGGKAIGEGVGGNALHFEGEETVGIIVSGNFEGGNGVAMGNSLLVTNLADVTISGGNFHGNVVVNATTLQIDGGIFQSLETEVVAAGPGSIVVFFGCFELDASETNEDVIYVTGSFFSGNELTPFQNITAKEVEGGIIGKTDHPSCDSVVPAPTKAPTISINTDAPTKEPTSPDEPIVIDDGGLHNITSTDSGIALYQVTNASKVRMEDAFTIIRAPVGLGREIPTFLIDGKDSQLFLSGTDILIQGSNGTSEFENGGPAIQVMDSGRGYFESSIGGGTSIQIRGGDAVGEGQAGDALRIDGVNTIGWILSGDFYGGFSKVGSSSVTTGDSLVATNSADVTIRGGRFFGNIMVNSSSTINIHGGVFQTGQTEVIVAGSASFATFHGCFELARSDDEEEIIFVTGYFLNDEGIGPFQNITTREIDGGQIGVFSGSNCAKLTLPPTRSPTTDTPATSASPTFSPSISSSPTANTTSGIFPTASPTSTKLSPTRSPTAKPTAPTVNGCAHTLSLGIVSTVFLLSTIFLVSI